MISHKIIEAKNLMNKNNIITDIALCVQDDLKCDGFDTELIKHNPKKPSTWRIVPKNKNLSKEKLEEFEEKKKKAQDYWVKEMKSNLKEYRKSLLK